MRTIWLNTLLFFFQVVWKSENSVSLYIYDSCFVCSLSYRGCTSRGMAVFKIIFYTVFLKQPFWWLVKLLSPSGNAVGDQSSYSVTVSDSIVNIDYSLWWNTAEEFNWITKVFVYFQICQKLPNMEIYRIIMYLLVQLINMSVSTKKCICFDSSEVKLYIFSDIYNSLHCLLIIQLS